jgi:eukaryotic-like serine/threonine-protein kinase
VKPGNIMVLPDGRVKIMDFGIARPHEPTVKTQTGLLLGSPQYMSPEQIVGRPFDHRADIFSLGLVLYEMVTGIRPFAGEDIPELTFKVANVSATPPSHVVPGLPPVADMIVARALKKKPEERYASAADFARDLWAAIPEVKASEAAQAQRASASTVPLGDEREAGRSDPPAPLRREEPVELRASPRFDSSAALARLPVLSAEGELARTRADTTALRRPWLLRRIDPDRAATVIAFVIAALAAAAIALG